MIPGMDTRDRPPTRRDLLAQLALGLTASAAASLPGCALFLSSVEPDIVVPVNGTTLLIPRAALPWEHGGGDALVVGLAGRPDDKLLVLRAQDGELIALTTTCTHRGCDVRWNDERDRIVCPCHGSEYDVHGGNLKGPAKRPLQRYALSVGPEGLLVTLS